MINAYSSPLELQKPYITLMPCLGLATECSGSLTSLPLSQSVNMSNEFMGKSQTALYKQNLRLPAGKPGCAKNKVKQSEKMPDYYQVSYNPLLQAWHKVGCFRVLCQVPMCSTLVQATQFLSSQPRNMRMLLSQTPPPTCMRCLCKQKKRKQKKERKRGREIDRHIDTHIHANVYIYIYM